MTCRDVRYSKDLEMLRTRVREENKVMAWYENNFNQPRAPVESNGIGRVLFE
jgi:hypothetical protein